MIVEKKQFSLESYRFENGQEIPVELGYEAYGELNAAKSNCILICHYFSGSSHAAGKYREEDPESGWWDDIIGPGKAFDTNKYFIVCLDNLCNLFTKNSKVVTTGPASKDPATGKPYGLRFPQVLYRDNVKIQKKFLESIGVKKLVCVAGPSAGGFQSIEWAVTYPDMVEKIIPVTTAPRMNALHGTVPAHAAISTLIADPNFNGGDYYGRKEPIEGLTRALEIMTILARSFEWADENLGFSDIHLKANHGLQPLQPYEIKFTRIARQRAELYDANHFIYLTRAGQFFNIGYGYDSYEDAVKRIKAKVLMIPVSTDLYFPPKYSIDFVKDINFSGGNGHCYIVDSTGGHFAGVFECKVFSEIISSFLNGELI